MKRILLGTACAFKISAGEPRKCIRHLFIIGGFLVLVLAASGCNKGSSGGTTAFFRGHDPREHFGKIAEGEGLKVFGGETSKALGGLRSYKRSMVELAGGEAVRDRLMETYQGHIRQELAAMGGRIQAQGQWGTVSGFDFDYSAGGVTGYFHANAVVNQRGNIEVNVIMYEYR